MEASSSSSSSSSLDFVAVDESYRVLPPLYLAFLGIWCFSALSWTLNTWRNRNFQVSKLQWMLASVPMIKTLQLALSFSFWYSCTKLQICSVWISFGVYVTGILFQSASIVSFMLISHGYCVMYERISIPQRRKTAALGCVLYLTLVGYKAAVPYFTLLLLLSYSLSFYVIFRYISKNLFILREQLTLTFVEDGDVQTMHDALRTKYTMFKKFQGAMQIVALVEILVYLNVDERPESYWFRLLVREWAQFCIFLYIGWTFRTKEASSNFSVIPTMKWENTVPPIYSMEMDAADFKNLASWQVGVPTSFPSSHCKSSVDPLLVIVQHPHAASRDTSEALIRLKLSASRAATTVRKFARDDDHV